MNEKNPVNSPRVKPGSLTRALATKLIMIVGSHSAFQTLHYLHYTASNLTMVDIVLMWLGGGYIFVNRIYYYY